MFFVILCWVLFSCEPEPKKLTPRMMKQVDNEFRKIKKELRQEADSFCAIYQGEKLQIVVDSIVEFRMFQDKQKRIHIEE